MKIKKMTPQEIQEKFVKLGGVVPPTDDIDLQIMTAFLDGYKIGKEKSNKKNKTALNYQEARIYCLIESLKMKDITIDALKEKIRNQSNIIARFKMPLNPLHEEALKPEEK